MKELHNDTLQGFYYPQEYRIIAYLLNVPVPECAPQEWPEEEDYDNDEYQGIFKEYEIDDHYEFDDLSEKNAVARIALNGIQEKLPLWREPFVNDNPKLGRNFDGKSKTNGAFFPLHLFTINWGTSAPGFSWPEAYNVTLLPIFDYYVVTASQDSSEPYGCADITIGWFKASGDIKSNCEKIILKHWEHLSSQHTCKETDLRWAEFEKDGIFKEHDAVKLAHKVWPDPAFVDIGPEFFDLLSETLNNEYLDKYRIVERVASALEHREKAVFDYLENNGTVKARDVSKKIKELFKEILGEYESIL